MKEKETHIKKEKVDMIVAGRKKRSLFEKVYPDIRQVSYRRILYKAS